MLSSPCEYQCGPQQRPLFDPVRRHAGMGVPVDLPKIWRWLQQFARHPAQVRRRTGGRPAKLQPALVERVEQVDQVTLPSKGHEVAQMRQRRPPSRSPHQFTLAARIIVVMRRRLRA